MKGTTLAACMNTYAAECKYVHLTDKGCFRTSAAFAFQEPLQACSTLWTHDSALIRIGRYPFTSKTPCKLENNLAALQQGT